MAGDPDDTVRLTRPPARRPRPHGFWIAAALVVLAAAGAGWWMGHMAGPALTAIASAPVSAPAPSVTPASAPAAASLPRASEAELLARTPDGTEAYRFQSAPEIVVILFGSLADQADMFNRMAALIEKAGYPRDQVLDVAELNRRIRAGGDTPETFYYGHDYRAADVLRFFAALDRSGLPPTGGETKLRRMMQDWGWRPDTNEAVISLVHDDSVAVLDAQGRATILRHELSHGLYFTSPAYVHFVWGFWNGTLTEDERGHFRAMLANEGYDITIDDLVVNETQAYLEHTRSERFFNARAVGIAQVRLDELRALFWQGMPPGWLRDATVLPIRAPRRRRRQGRGQARGRVRTGRTAADTRAPLRAA